MSTVEKKRCLYLAAFDPTTKVSGTTTRGHLFLEFLARRYRIDLVYLALKKPGQTDRRLTHALHSCQGIPYSSFGNYLFSRRFQQAAQDAAQQHRPHFIIADCDKSGIYAYRVARSRNLPFIYISHNVEYKKYLSIARAEKFHYLLAPYMYLLEKLIVRNAALVSTVSSQDAATYQRWTDAAKLMVAPCAFDEDAINPNYDEDQSNSEPVVLFVGNFSYPGNLLAARLILDKIAPAVIAAIPDVIFKFVGRGFPAHEPSPNLRPLGFVEDIMEQYRSATVVIAPIVAGGGIKIKVVEALAAGRPLVATAKAIEGMDVADLDNLEVADIDGFAEALVRVIRNPPPRSPSNWPKVVQRFGRTAQLERLADAIDRLL